MCDRLHRLMPVAVVACALVVVARPVSAQFVQQGPKLAGSAAQGTSTALSADGNTAIVGGAFDDHNTGAVWIWTRSGASWAQQGPKLVGSGGASLAYQGSSVALSADGNTAIVGGPGLYTDSWPSRGAWVFVRSGGTWSQQGGLLIGTDTAGPLQGWSVAISADGNTAIVGGPGDNGGVGAAWVYVRSGGVWTQQGAKLVGSDFVSLQWEGRSVALSADGNTALVGAVQQFTSNGAVWVFTRSGGTWAQQGPKLTPSGGTYSDGLEFGGSLAVSADGNTAVIGGNNGQPAVPAGSTWVFTRSGGTWTQQGANLPTGPTRSVAISGDGNTIIAGRSIPYGTYGGGAWIFTRAGNTWSQDGPLLVGSGAPVSAGGVGLSSDGQTAIVGGPDYINGFGGAWIYTRVPVGVHVPIGVFPLADMDGDGKADLVTWRASTATWSWLTSSTGYDGTRAGSRPWGNQSLGDIPLTGDLDGDGLADLVVWRASTATFYWLTSSTGYANANARDVAWGNQALGDVPLLADVDGDGKADLGVWRASTGMWYWLTSSSGYAYASAWDLQWGNSAYGDQPFTGDFDGDGKADLVVWRPTDGTWYWLTSSTKYSYASAHGLQWGVTSLGDVPLLGDFDGDGKSDLAVWRASTGTWYWLSSSTGYTYASAHAVQWGNMGLGDVPLLGDFDGDGRADIAVWRGSTGTWYWLSSSSGYSYAAAHARQFGDLAWGDMPR